MSDKTTTPVSVQIGTVSFTFQIEHDRHIIELLAASHAMRDTVARALHLGLRHRADELAQNIQNAAVLVDGQRLEGTEEEDPPQ